MARDDRKKGAVPYELKTWRDFPPMNVSMGTMLHNHTGSWRFIKPIYEDKIPSCQAGCPAGNDIEAWIKLIQREEYGRAYWHLKREEPFPAILGRVCFSFCEGKCNREFLDDHIGIRDLERFVGDQVPRSTPYPDLPSYHGKSLGVVGSGPAGMSAAYFARLLGFQVTVFEAM
ncbi:MAG: NAD(P)-binding protein, partial [Deltaproteobacteria bacterium]